MQHNNARVYTLYAMPGVCFGAQHPKFTMNEAYNRGWRYGSIALSSFALLVRSRARPFTQTLSLSHTTHTLTSIHASNAGRERRLRDRIDAIYAMELYLSDSVRLCVAYVCAVRE